MADRGKYTKIPTGGAGIHGADYQIKLLTLFLLEAYQIGEDFWLSTENEKGGKFDDVVLETTTKCILLQAKHKEDPKNEKNFIKYEDIFPTGKNREEFNLYKYMESFVSIKKHFSHVTALILCTNTSITEDDDIETYTRIKKMDRDHIFKFCDDKIYYTFKKGCKQLLLDKNPDLSEDDIETFLSKLQLISVSDTNIDARINEIIINKNLFNASVDLKQAVNFLKNTVKVWFLEKNKNKKSIYITREYLETFRSKHYICELKNNKVEFKVNNQTNDERYTCYVIKKKEHVDLHLLKTYQYINSVYDKGKMAGKILIINPNESADIKKNVISTFKIEKFIFLIVPIFKSDYQDLISIMEHIVQETAGKAYKKIIFLTDDANTLQNLHIQLKIDILPLVEPIIYENLSDYTKGEICSKNIIFQGKPITLKDIIHPQIEKLNTLLDESTIYKLLKGEDIIIGDNNKDPIINFYIPRSFYDKSKKISITEEDLCELITEDNDMKTYVIADMPGMGKTTILSTLYNILKSKYTYWIVKIHLNEVTEKLRFSKDNTGYVTVEELIKNPPKNFFERNIFNIQKKVIIMLDAFDEISPDYAALIQEFIESCENSENIRKILVTTRPHCENDIIKTTKKMVFSLRPFSIEDQRRFLFEYWSEKLEITSDNSSKCEEYIEKLMKKLGETIVDNWSLVGIPLQSRIIAEIFQNDCYAFISMNTFETDSSKKLNIANLYDMFINNKKNIYINEKSNAPGNIIVGNTLSKEFDNSVQEHTKLALKIIFNKNKRKYFKILQTQDSSNISEEFLLKMGILQKNSETLQFTHLTFAEYFVAKYICNTLYQTNIDGQYLYFLIMDVFFSKQYKMIQTFMGNILENQSIPQHVLELCGEITPKMNWDRITNDLNLTPSHNLLKIVLQECKNIKTVKSWNSLLLIVLSDYSIFQILLERGANIFEIYKYNKTLLHLSALHYSKEVVKFLIEHGLDVDALDDFGNTPLHEAVKAKNFEMTKLLVTANANKEIKNHKGATPLLVSCYEQALDCAKFLIDNEADTTAVDNEKRNIAHCLVTNNFSNNPKAEEIVLEILKNNNKVVNGVCIKGMTALHYAVKADNSELTQLLLKAGAEMEIKNNDGATPLILACSERAHHCAKHLIRNGADINSTDKKGHNALYYLRENSLYECLTSTISLMDIVLEKNVVSINNIFHNGMTALHYAVKAKNIEKTKTFLAAGANKEIRNNEGATPLLVACYEKAIECAKYLIDNGSDVTMTDNKGRNALHFLVMHRSYQLPEDCIELINFILEKNMVHINNVCNDGMTALHYAVRAKNFKITKLLITAGADKEITNNRGLTPFLLACLDDSLDCAKFLIDIDADITAIDRTKRNALHCLTEHDVDEEQKDIALEIMSMIVEKNVININSVCFKGMTPLHYAVKNRNLEMTRLLIGSGAHKEIKNRRGSTPFLLACAEQSLECARFLLHNGADLTTTNIYGKNALHYLVGLDLDEKEEDIAIEILTTILNRKALEVDGTCNKGFTPLHYAVPIENLEIIKLLLASAADMEQECYKGATPLLHALYEESFDCAKLLIEKGANIAATDFCNRDALHYLVYHLYDEQEFIPMEILNTILEKNVIDLNSVCNKGMTGLHAAVKAKNLDMAKMIITAGINIEIKNNKGATPFLVACFEESLDCAKYLIQKGADVTATDNRGRNGLHCLLEHNLDDEQNITAKEIVNIILDEHNIIDNVCNINMTALHYSVKADNLEITKLLINKNANKEIKNIDGATPFLLACFEKSLNCAKYLIDNGADSSITDNQGRNALHYLADHRFCERQRIIATYIMSKILKTNINVNNVCNNGMTALHYATRAKNFEMVQLLLAAGADKNIKNNKGFTPVVAGYFEIM